MKKHDGAAYCIADWAILARLSVLDAKRAADWLMTTTNEQHPYIRRGAKVFLDDETYTLSRSI